MRNELVAMIVGVILISISASAASRPGNAVPASAFASAKARIIQANGTEKIELNPAFGTAERVSGLFSTPGTGTKAEKSLEFIAGKRDVYRIDQPENEFKILDESTDDLGLSHVRFQQVYRGVPVWGNQIIVHFADDTTIYLTGGQIMPTPDINVVPSISEIDARNAALNDLKGTIDTTGAIIQSEVVIYPNEGDPRLSRLLTITDSDNPSFRWRVFVDAQTGSVLFKFNDIAYDGPDTGSGPDVTNVERTFPIYQQGGIYVLRDVTRAGEIDTYINYLHGGGLSADLDGDKVWDDSIPQRAEVSAHVFSGWAYDFFKNIFDRESYDGFGADIIANAHDANTVNNAYWNGVSLNFGDGDGVNFLPFSGSPDVVAHEYTHAVTEYNGHGGLIYSFQPGALNESYSDVFGSGVDTTDWLLGEDIRITYPYFIRSMANPNLTGQPKNMNDYRYYDINVDNGGVHVNSGISNYAFYRVVAVYGIPRVKADSIWYRTLLTYLTPNSGFNFWAGMLTQSAIDLYGFGSAEHMAIENALADVGLGTVFAVPQSFSLHTLLGTSSNSSLWIHNTGGYSGAPSMSNLAPTLNGLSLDPGPGYQASIPAGDSSEYIVTFDATAMTGCDLGLYVDTLQFYATTGLGVTELRVPVEINVGLTTASDQSTSFLTQCAQLNAVNTASASDFFRNGYDALYGATLMIGLRDGTDTTVYRTIFGTQTFAPVDTFQTAAGTSTYRFSTYDGRIQGNIRYRWDPSDADSCEFFLVDYSIFNDCDTALSVLNGMAADLDIGNDRTGYDSGRQMVYMYDTGARAVGLALLGATARNLRAINNPTQVYNNAFTDGLAYRQMAATSSTDGTTLDDWTILLTFGQNQLAAADTLKFTVAMMYSTAGVTGLAPIYDKAVAFAGLGGLSYIPGDANGDGTVNIGDAVMLVNYIFKSGPAPDPLDAGDANCDGAVNIGDAVYLIDYIFHGGPPPGCP